MAKNINSTWITTDLILKNSQYGEDEIICIMSGESIDLIEAVADVAKEVHVYDNSFQRITRLNRYLKAKNVKISHDVYPPAEAIYDTAIIIVPKGREVARAQVMTAMQAVKQGGDLYIAGPNKGGAKSVIKDAQKLFNACQVLDFKKSHRVALSIKQQDYDYPIEWGAKPYEQQMRTFDTPLGKIDVVTMPGIFSWDELDAGTSLLLENVNFQDIESILDIGCGNGVIASLAAKAVDRVTMVDDNLLAVYCAQSTVEHNQLTNVEVVASNVFSKLENQTFDLIVSNPPFHKKFDVNTNVANRLITEAKDHLNPNGRLLIVVNTFLKYESALSEHFKYSRVVIDNGKFKVLEGVI
ncbi:MAG: class I SAM-dependent methyltransferase [Anaerolineae bacterium]|nr:class I SAM-dependent methyltransferase [Anaerolineae bacterium]